MYGAFDILYLAWCDDVLIRMPQDKVKICIVAFFNSVLLMGEFVFQYAWVVLKSIMFSMFLLV